MEADHTTTTTVSLQYISTGRRHTPLHTPATTHTNMPTMTALPFAPCRLLARRQSPGAAGARARRTASQPPLALARRSTPSLALVRRSNTSSNNNSGGAWQILILLDTS